MMARPNFTKGVGGLTLDRYTADAHFQGTQFRHSADQIDVTPSVIINGIPYITVASALSAVGAYIAQDVQLGAGFIAIPDGYDTYHASDVSAANPPPNANFPYDGPGTAFATSTPALDPALNDLLNNTANPLYHRTRDGGIVLLKAGTYVITNTVNLPPGTIIMGEGFGTKIVNKMSSSGPLFRVKADSSKSFGTAVSDPGSDPTKSFMPTRETKLYNLVISDNFVEPIVLGDTTYQQPKNVSIATTTTGSSFPLPQATIPVVSTTNFPTSGIITVVSSLGSQLVSYTGTTPTSFTGCTGGSGTVSSGAAVGASQPLVLVEEGANFACELVRFLGRVVYSASNVSALTAYAIKTDPAVPITTGTMITVRNCFFDGFSQLVRTTNLGGINDYFTFTNNYARVYGFLNADSTSDPNNTFFNLTSSNVNVQSNFLWANTAVAGTDTVLSLVWLNDGPSGVLTINQYPRITIANNNISTNQALSSPNTTFSFLKKSSNGHLISFSNPQFTSIVFGNNYDSLDSWSVDTTGAGLPQLMLGFNTLTHKGTFVVGATPLAFDPTVINPVMQQTSTTTGPNSLTISGQTTSQATTQGGGLVLSGGGGTSANGLVSVGSFDGGRLPFTPANGSNTLSIIQSTNNFIDLQAGATGAVSLTISRPAANAGQVLVTNRTSQTVSVFWLSDTGTGVTINTGNSAWIGTDGTKAIALMNGT